MTHENKNFVRECAVIAKIFNRLYQSDMGLCGVDSRGGTPCVHLLHGGFMQLFGDSYEVAERQDNAYPWILYHMVNGVKFYCITEKNPRSKP